MALATVYSRYFNATFPDESDVRQDTAYTDGVTQYTGTLVVGGGAPNYPGQADVRTGIQYGTTGSEEFTGILDLPEVSDVRLAVAFDNSTKTGILDLPKVSDVRLAVAFDNSTKTGNVRLPAVTDVRAGVQYDSNDSLTGTLVVGGGDPNYPGQTDVRTGIQYGTTGSEEFTGSLDLPAVSDVRLAVSFDNDTKTGNVRLPAVTDVRAGVQYDSNDSLTGTLVVGGTPSTDRTEFFRWESGAKLYALKSPANWLETAFSGVANPNDGGQYQFDGLDYGEHYEVYEQAGAEPAQGDSPAGYFEGPKGAVGDFEADYPSESNVRDGIVYANGTFTGNVVLPGESDVRESTQYGALGTEFTGTLIAAGSGPYPGVEDVRFGVAFGTGLVGVLELPTPSQVLVGVGYGSYGTELEGTLEELPGGTGQILAPVLASGQLRTPLIAGDSYTSELKTSFQWTIDPQTGMSALTAECRFYGRKTCFTDCDDSDNDWDVDGTVTDGGSGVGWILEFEMDSDESAKIPAGEYNWFVEITDQGDVLTVEMGQVDWICR